MITAKEEQKKSNENDKYGLLETINRYLANRPDAAQFLLLYRDYCHAIDDIIDIPERRNDNEFILYTFNMAHDIFSCAFYQENVGELYSVVKIIHNLYADSVKWETSDIQWQKQVSDVTRNCANIMISTVVRIVVRKEEKSPWLGYEAMRDISSRAVSQSYHDHHDESGNAI